MRVLVHAADGRHGDGVVRLGVGPPALDTFRRVLGHNPGDIAVRVSKRVIVEDGPLSKVFQRRVTVGDRPFDVDDRRQSWGAGSVSFRPAHAGCARTHHWRLGDLRAGKS